MIADKKVVAMAPVRELEKSDHPWIKRYFHGARGRAAAAAAEAGDLPQRDKTGAES